MFSLNKNISLDTNLINRSFPVRSRLSNDHRHAARLRSSLTISKCVLLLLFKMNSPRDWNRKGSSCGGVLGQLSHEILVQHCLSSGLRLNDHTSNLFLTIFLTLHLFKVLLESQRSDENGPRSKKFGHPWNRCFLRFYTRTKRGNFSVFELRSVPERVGIFVGSWWAADAPRNRTLDRRFRRVQPEGLRRLNRLFFLAVRPDVFVRFRRVEDLLRNGNSRGRLDRLLDQRRNRYIHRIWLTVRNRSNWKVTLTTNIRSPIMENKFHRINARGYHHVTLTLNGVVRLEEGQLEVQVGVPDGET